MKLTCILLFTLIVVNNSYAMNPLKMPDSIKSKVFSAAGKFLSNKGSKTPITTNTVNVPNPNGKTSRMSQLVDIGTNTAMALAGAGTLFQALSGDKSKATTVSVSIISLRKFYF